MPFTFSHPAAVLPFARLRLPAPALIIGSIVPDLGYYVPLPWDSMWMHTPAGALTDLACGIVAFALWRVGIAPAAVDIMPAQWRRRVAAPKPHLGLRGASAVVAAIALGMLTHLVWDAFTHDWMWGPTHLAWLNHRLGPLAVYNWAQCTSSAGGLVVVYLWWRSWWKRSRLRSPLPPGLPEWMRNVCWTVIATSAICGGLFGTATASEKGSLADVAFAGFTRTVTGMIAALAAICAGLWLRRWIESMQPRTD